MDHSLSKECRFRCVVTAIVKRKRLETSSRGVYCSPEAALLGPGSFRAISDHQCFAKCGSSTPPSAKMGMLAPSLTVLWLQCVPAQTFPSHTNGMQQAVKCSRNPKVRILGTICKCRICHARPFGTARRFAGTLGHATDHRLGNLDLCCPLQMAPDAHCHKRRKSST